MVREKGGRSSVFFLCRSMGTETANRRKELQAFYNTPAWRRTREAYRQTVGGLCEDCKARGIIRAGDCVHHVIPLTPSNLSSENITLDFANLRLLCDECHARVHQERGDETSAGRRKGKPIGKQRKRRYKIDENTGKVVIDTPPRRENSL